MSEPIANPGGPDALITFLPTTDLAASREFYEHVLGLELVVDQLTCFIFRVTNTAFLGVCDKPRTVGADGVITTFVTADVDGWCARVTAADWKLDSGPEHSPTYGIYHAFLTDPAGNRIEIQRFDDPGWTQPQFG